MEVEKQASEKQDIDSETIKNTIAGVQKQINLDFVLFKGEIPEDILNNAVTSFANQAKNEDVLALVLSDKKGKSGFLFTDKALYHMLFWGYEKHRIPYRTIQNISLDNKFLEIESFGRNSGKSIKWDLRETVLMGERGRRKVADPVVLMLQTVLSGQTTETSTEPPATNDYQETTKTVPPPSNEDQKVKVTVEAPTDWPSVYAFHGPILVLGAMVIMPIAYRIMAKAGILGHEMEYAIHDFDFMRLISLGFISLVPTMYAYGTELKFSFGRFILAAVVIMALSYKTLMTTNPYATETEVFIMPLGGGVLGLVVAMALGHAGLSIKRLFEKKND